MIKKILIFLFIFSTILAVPQIILANNSKENILVKFQKEKNIGSVAEELGLNEKRVKKIEKLNVYKIENPSFWQKTRLQIKKLLGEIEYIEPTHKIKSHKIANDTYYSEQWGLNKISAPQAWDTTTGSNDIIIAVIDSGINGTHPDLLGKTIEGYDFVEDQAIPEGVNSEGEIGFGHGTAVTGIISAVTNNNIGIAGVAWQAQIMPIRVLDSYGYGEDYALAEGIIYAADHGAKIINMSLGGADPSTTLSDAIDYAYSRNVLLIASSGNDYSSVSYPAKYEKVLSVGSTNQNDSRSFFSNYGQELDVVAPGEDIVSTYYHPLSLEEYSSYDGTSFSAPFVSGIASLVWAQNPNFSNTHIKYQIEENTDKVSRMEGNNFSSYYGYGRVNAYKALNPSPTSIAEKYSYQYISQNIYPTVNAGEGNNFVISLKNTGTAIWYKGTVNLGTDRSQDRIPSFIRADLSDPNGHPSHWISPNRIIMNEDSVAPGENATYSFWMSAPTNMSSGTYREYFRPVVDGVTWLNDIGIFWDVHVRTEAEKYHYGWFGQNDYPPILTQGQSYNFILTVRNIGYTTWQRGTVNLGTDRAQDRIPGFIREDVPSHNPSGWILPNRIIMQQESVAPSANATFSFWLTVPEGMSSGTYREYFRLVADNITWMEDYGIYWDITVH